MPFQLQATNSANPVIQRLTMSSPRRFAHGHRWALVKSCMPVFGEFGCRNASLLT